MHHHKYRLIIPFLLPAILLYGVFVDLAVRSGDLRFPHQLAGGLRQQAVRWVGELPTAAGRWPLPRGPDAQRPAPHRLAISHHRHRPDLCRALHPGHPADQGRWILPDRFFLSQIIPAVIVGILWSYIYTPNVGLLNGILRAIGLGDVSTSWLTDPTTVLWAVVAVAIWSSVGFYMVIFLASMQSIPTSFYEAAILDGATRWTSFKDITFPLIWETIRTSVIYLAIAALDFFILIVVISGGSTTTTARRAEVAALYLYNQAFDSSRWGYASAIGVVLLVLTLFLSLGIMRATRRETYEF